MCSLAPKDGNESNRKSPRCLASGCGWALWGTLVPWSSAALLMLTSERQAEETRALDACSALPLK